MVAAFLKLLLLLLPDIRMYRAQN
uniref:Uncharacterized protein n=1 Tax=Anguilla anguilla TaxID=7936 RepID=A0A0E9Q8R5_ANGAN